MRSWTTFYVFGGILVALVLFYWLSQRTTYQVPAVRACQQFIDAVKRNDAVTAKGLLDPKKCQIATYGSNHIININFMDTSSIVNIAFAKQDAVSWDYQALLELKIEPNAKPTILENDDLARVPLNLGRSAYLRRIAGQWKIFYITKNPSKK